MVWMKIFRTSQANTHFHIASITLWHDELLMNLFAFPNIATSMALPTLSSTSSPLSSLACKMWRSAPDHTCQLVVRDKVRSMLFSFWRNTRIARISQSCALEHDTGAVVRLSSRRKWTRLIKQQNVIDKLPSRWMATYFSVNGRTRV